MAVEIVDVTDVAVAMDLVVELITMVTVELRHLIYAISQTIKVINGEIAIKINVM